MFTVMWPLTRMQTMLGNSFLLILLALFGLALGNDLAKGWGDAIDWVTLDKGMELSKAEGKPLMLLIHKSWCGACKALKPRFSTDDKIKELSEKLIMVNTEDEEEPSGDQYKPDGGYIPRILFLDPEGNVDRELYNENGSDRYKYYFPSTSDIVSAMNKALEKYGGNSGDLGKTEL